MTFSNDFYGPPAGPPIRPSGGGGELQTNAAVRLQGREVAARVFDKLLSCAINFHLVAVDRLLGKRVTTYYNFSIL